MEGFARFSMEKFTVTAPTPASRGSTARKVSNHHTAPALHCFVPVQFSGHGRTIIYLPQVELSHILVCFVTQTLCHEVFECIEFGRHFNSLSNEGIRGTLVGVLSHTVLMCMHYTSILSS